MVPSVLFMHVHENIKKWFKSFKSQYSKELYALQTKCKCSQPFNFQELISNSPYCLPNDSYNVSLENLVADQLVIPLFIFLLNSYHLSA